MSGTLDHIQGPILAMLEFGVAQGRGTLQMVCTQEIVSQKGGRGEMQSRSFQFKNLFPHGLT